MISYSPILYAISAAFFYSNMQVFGKDVGVIQNGEVFSRSGDSFGDVFFKASPGTIFVIFLAFISVAIFGRGYIQKIEHRFHKRDIEGLDKEIAEDDLVDYSKSLPLSKRDRWLCEGLVSS